MKPWQIYDQRTARILATHRTIEAALVCRDARRLASGRKDHLIVVRREER